MSSKTKQDILRFPVRKTRSRSQNDKKLDCDEYSLLINGKGLPAADTKEKRASRRKKNESNYPDQENILSPTKKNCSSGVSPSKNGLVVLNNSIPVVHLERTPLKCVSSVSNSCHKSSQKLKRNVTPTKENETFSSRYPVLHDHDSLRVSPHKVNFTTTKDIQTNLNRLPALLDVGSPRRSPRKVTFTPTKDIPANLSRCPLILDLDSPRRSPRKLNFTPTKDIQTNLSKCSARLDLDSPRRSPRKLNFTPTKDIQTNLSRCSAQLDLGSPRRSPRKLNFENSPSHLISKLSFSSPKATGPNIGLHKIELKVYQALKASLTQNCDTEIVGRLNEINSLKEFLGEHLRNSRPGSLYVSGAPGTGKTALVTKIIKEFCDVSYKQIILNCMSKTTSKEIFSAIAEGLKLNVNRTEGEIIKQIEKSLTKSKVPVVIILDEVDQLESRDQKVLYTLFEWPALDNSKLILIGIANMLDLTDRILPRLQSVKSCKPRLLHFPPYNRSEIVQIINERIKEANIGDGVQVIKPSAILFLAGKVSSVAGDVRKALDVCRRAVELCEIQVKKQMRLVHRSPSKSPRKLSNFVIKQVDIPQVLAIFNEIYGSKVANEITENPNAFPLQQKVLICSFLLILKHSKTKTVNLGQFHEVYSRVCVRQNLPSIEQSEFFSLCTLLEARGMLQVKKTKELRNSKLFLRLNEDETVAALGDKILLANVLEDKQSLGKYAQKSN